MCKIETHRRTKAKMQIIYIYIDTGYKMRKWYKNE